MAPAFNSQANVKDEEDMVNVLNMEDELNESPSRVSKPVVAPLSIHSEEIKEEIKVEDHVSEDLMGLMADGSAHKLSIH